ncbi:MAG TPA: carbohydrate ABC transporter permease [Propionibacteriaceae bacterium]|jgi:raffinose/stachyose/melibiose transport system permease protein|nr:carbohydrate ABC transporter permease [Propionibacteriaceae bacterium]
MATDTVAATGSITTSEPRRRRNTRGVVIGGAAILVSAIFFLVPFLFIFVIASKPLAEANLLEFSWPSSFVLLDNLQQALAARDYLMVIAFINSVILTVASVAALVILSAMVAYVWQRRASRLNSAISLLVLAGLIVPPAVVPTIWVLQTLGLFKTMPGLILIEIAYGLPFCILLFRAFVATIPRELDEAAVVDGAGSVQIFFRVIFPVLRSVIMTVIILQSVLIYNDFQHPLYFLPGTENATVQLTLLNFQSQFTTQYNLLFATILLVTIPPLIMFIFFNRKIVEGMAAGSVKG